jgi:hypothetical protein
MKVYEAIALAARLESLVRRADTFGPKTREDILEEVADMASDLRKYADQIDREMNAIYEKEYA